MATKLKSHMKQNLLIKISRLLFATMVIVCLFCSNLFAQNTAVRGIVLDNNGQPLPGVSVTVKGTTRGTITGIEGRFTLSAQKGETLVVRIIGFETQEQVIGDEINLSFQLKAETNALTEVVVTALGVKKEFQKLGYSQSQIKGDDLTVGRDANPFNSMEGK